ncbi:MAG TPA: TlpA disulfide reductase family protein [Rhodopila sp.]|nr:TlpA disulfide reductase family protein [Rhodopila sp.]
MRRRTMLAAAAGTLATTALPRKPRAESLPPVAEGMHLVEPPVPAPDTPFRGQDGSVHHLADFKGHGMLVNMWATWCAPCGAEMPSLQALSKALAPDDIAVLPLSSDRGGASVVADWYRAHGITNLPILLDPKGQMAHALNVRGIPTTIIIDTAGMVVARLEGGADWGSPEAQAVIRKLVAG